MQTAPFRVRHYQRNRMAARITCIAWLLRSRPGPHESGNRSPYKPPHRPSIGLRQRKTARAEVDRRVTEVSAMLGLNKLLARRPAREQLVEPQHGADLRDAPVHLGPGGLALAQPDRWSVRWLLWTAIAAFVRSGTGSKEPRDAGYSGRHPISLVVSYTERGSLHLRSYADRIILVRRSRRGRWRWCPEPIAAARRR